MQQIEPGDVLPGLFHVWDLLTIQFEDRTALPGFRRRLIRFSDQQTVGLCQRQHHGAVPDREGGRDQALRRLRERRAQIVRSLVIGGKVAGEQRRFGWQRQIAASGEATDERNEEQEGAYKGRNRIAGNAEDLHGTESAVHKRTAGPQHNFQYDNSMPSTAKAFCTRLYSPTEAPPVVTRMSAPISRARSNRRDRIVEPVGDNPEVNDFGAFRAREHQVLTVYNVF